MNYNNRRQYVNALINEKINAKYSKEKQKNNYSLNDDDDDDDLNDMNDEIEDISFFIDMDIEEIQKLLNEFIKICTNEILSYELAIEKDHNSKFEKEFELFFFSYEKQDNDDNDNNLNELWKNVFKIYNNYMRKVINLLFTQNNVLNQLIEDFNMNNRRTTKFESKKSYGDNKHYHHFLDTYKSVDKIKENYTDMNNIHQLFRNCVGDGGNKYSSVNLSQYYVLNQIFDFNQNFSNLKNLLSNVDKHYNNDKKYKLFNHNSNYNYHLISFNLETFYKKSIENESYHSSENENFYNFDNFKETLVKLNFQTIINIYKKRIGKIMI
jgi:hypothetical protein